MGTINSFLCWVNEQVAQLLLILYCGHLDWAWTFKLNALVSTSLEFEDTAVL